ncbi:isocitrate lyase/phosphoenolpyruvate mutase family protein [Nonomuraea sp. K274]|uniref:Isocitrate lyase/phosphoenolpyruvate mutase family protein n=1 Tax=Nonomuraea cypriaca TaxID=1187855 RepID=A0A931AEM5_9ACTN|nr:isocitrate lyase/phosphoenolpyruvate mutase family protein [Nonomuraea cypriaca]MBF8191547.1 isocitrate lyase/phosphoenolpyruvate mutase family protein [Nonomuraea cypriaca]
MELNAKAELLRGLHQDLLILPNAWDAASAAAVVHAGASAVATTSAGIAWAQGRADGHKLSRAEMVEAVRRICAVVDVPVTADIENGYGDDPDDVAGTVEQIIDAGAVGVNLEDSRSPREPLHTPGEQAARIHSARQAAVRAGVPDLFINARTDVYFFQVGAVHDRNADVLARAAAYASAGADCLFVPGLLDPARLRELAGASPLPLNAMAVPGGPTVAQLAATGVRRVSVGAQLHLSAYASAHRAAVELLATGTFHAFTDASEVAPLVMRF